MAGASARCGAEDAGIATLEVDSGRSCSRRRTSSPAIFEVQGDRFRSYSMFQNLNSAKAYSKSFLKMVSNTVRVLWLLRESVLTSVQRLANPAVYCAYGWIVCPCPNRYTHFVFGCRKARIILKTATGVSDRAASGPAVHILRNSKKQKVAYHDLILPLTFTTYPVILRVPHDEPVHFHQSD